MTRMKKQTMRRALTSLLSVLTVGLGGCELMGDGFNATKLRQAVAEEFKTTDVVLVPGQSFKFIVRTSDGAVWIAEGMGSEAKVTAKTELFSAQ